MLEIKISIADASDQDEIRQMLATTIRDTFEREKIILAYPKEMEDETKAVFTTYLESLARPQKAMGFWVARIEGRIVGTAALGTPHEIIRNHFEQELWQLPELKSVYVLPNFQKLGLGKALFKSCLKHLITNQLDEFFLAGGYSGSIVYWKKVLGLPSLILKDHWGPKQDHCIWRCQVANL